jgi:hypothetical protein
MLENQNFYCLSRLKITLFHFPNQNIVFIQSCVDLSWGMDPVGGWQIRGVFTDIKIATNN